MEPISGSSTQNNNEGSALNTNLRRSRNLGEEQDCNLFLFTIASYFTIASAFAVTIAQLILILGVAEVLLVETSVRIYGIVLCIGVIFTELEMTEVARSFILLQNWIFRGVCYAFVGLLAMNYSNVNENLDISSQLYVTVSSLSLVTMGTIYSCMGVLCLKRIRDDKMAKYIRLLSHLEIQNAMSGRA